MIKKGALTVGDFLRQIRRLREDGKITLDTPLVYSHDDEGNARQCPVYTPGLVYSNDEPSYGTYIDIHDKDEKPESSFTYLCIN